MKTTLIRATAGAAALAAGLAGAQTYSTYPAYGYSNTASGLVRCESNDSRRTLCRADTRGGVQIYRQLSRKDCVRGRNWQVVREGILVDDGCRADFALGAAYGTTSGGYMGTDRYGRPIYSGAYGNGGYTTDRYGNRVYVGTTGGYSNGGYTADRYGNRVYVGTTGGYSNGGYTTDRYGNRVYVGTTGGYTTDRYGNRVYTGTYGADPYAYDRSGDRIYVETGAGGYYTDRYGRRIYDANRDVTDDIYERNRDMGYPGTVTTLPVTTMPASMPATTTYGDSTIYCQSAAAGRTYCGDRTRTYTLQKQNANCLLERTYGKDSNGTWVSGGCSIKLEPTGF
jgi:hypothetical protein